jgi:tetratricopeptide (TPR) repeat protein
MLAKKLRPTDPATPSQSSLASEIDLKIRAGQIGEARKSIKLLKIGSIPRSDIVTMANLARRVGMATWGLLLLRPILRSEKPIHPPANVAEKAIYAALLIKVGAVTEALALLKDHQEPNHPDVLLYSSYAYMERWEYGRVIDYLQKYLKCAQVSAYQKAIAKVNLAAALVHEEHHPEALDLLIELRAECQREKWSLLQGNCLEISAQIAIKQNKWNMTESLLDEAEKLNAEAHRYQLFIEKWRVIAKLIQNPKSSAVFAETEQLRAKAISMGAWETHRDLDLHLGMSREDQPLLVKLYFGTPYRSYRRQIEDFFRLRGWTFPNSLLWSFAESSPELSLGTTNETSPQECVLNIYEGAKNGVALVKAGQNLHRLLILLSSDLYRPISIGYVFSQLYPKEFFNPLTSPSRVFHNIKRLRNMFTENKIPIHIMFDKGHSSLKPTGPVGLLLQKNSALTPLSASKLSQLAILKNLKKHFPFRSFSVGDAAQQTSLSPTTIRTILKNALLHRRVYSTGVGRATRYRFQK